MSSLINVFFYHLLILLALYSFLIPHPLGAAEMYQWENQQGEMVFGDRPPGGVDATPITVDEIPRTGNRFSSEQQIQRMHQDAAIRREVERRELDRSQPRIDSHCREYISQLNKAEIQIERSYNVRDAQKAIDLRKLIKKECGENVYSIKHDDWRCRQYRRELEKAKIYLQHTPNSVDEKKVDVLTGQIARECR